MAEDILAKDPLAGIVVDKPEPPPVPILTDEDLTALLNACKGKGFNDLRDAAVIRLLIDCGLRVSELARSTNWSSSVPSGNVGGGSQRQRLRWWCCQAPTPLASAHHSPAGP